ncbi:hypothetical protein A3Q56_06823 [Intoshia linei]|uniref:Uncharacterized protein n=1 Tax=Intoshia linei TaxID=1819745 RepID=A0A177ATY7_9BILA|nr:hypothetical protein A3Q56_06823 [Intoshia linei]
MQNVTEETSSLIATSTNLRQTIRRKQRLESSYPPIPHDIRDFEIPISLTLTTYNRKFLLYDSGVGDKNRILIYYTTSLMQILKDSKYWMCDGTLI